MNDHTEATLVNIPDSRIMITSKIDHHHNRAQYGCCPEWKMDHAEPNAVIL